MRLSIFCCALALTVLVAAQSKTATHQLLGTWKYDLKTMALEPNAQVKKEMSDPKKGPQIKQVMKELRENLSATLQTMRLTFKADRKVSIVGGSPPSESLGMWTLKGRSISILMTNTKQKTPLMELDKDGKRIHTIYSDPQFGVGKVDLVKS